MNAKLNLKPTAGNIIIQPLEAETKTSSGIYLPDNASEKPQKGKVLAVGGPVYVGTKTISSPAKVGQVVIYKKWGGNEVKIGNVEYVFVEFKDVLAVEA